MDYELWRDLHQRRMEEAEVYRLQQRVRRRTRRPRRVVRLLTIGGALAVVVLGGLLVTATGAG